MSISAGMNTPKRCGFILVYKIVVFALLWISQVVWKPLGNQDEKNNAKSKDIDLGSPVRLILVQLWGHIKRRAEECVQITSSISTRYGSCKAKISYLEHIVVGQ